MALKVCIGCRRKHIPVGRAQRCDDCARECERARRRRRGTRHQRGYDAEWFKLAARAIRAQPYCSVCGTTEDLTVDHRDPSTRGKPGLTLNDVDVLCRPCNSSKSDRPPDGRRAPRFRDTDQPPADEVLIA